MTIPRRYVWFAPGLILMALSFAHTAQLESMSLEDGANQIARAAAGQKLLFVGEHGHQDAKMGQVLAALLTDLEPSLKIDCLLMEQDPIEDPVYADFLNSNKTFRETVIAFVRRSQVDSSIASRWERTTVRQEAMAVAARRLGVNVLGIDINFDGPLGLRARSANASYIKGDRSPAVLREIADVIYEARNEAMANSIERLVRTGQCKRPLIFTEIRHLVVSHLPEEVEVGADKIPSVADRLANRGLDGSVLDLRACNENCPPVGSLRFVPRDPSDDSSVLGSLVFAR